MGLFDKTPAQTEVPQDTHVSFPEDETYTVEYNFSEGSTVYRWRYLYKVIDSNGEIAVSGSAGSDESKANALAIVKQTAQRALNTYIKSLAVPDKVVETITPKP